MPRATLVPLVIDIRGLVRRNATQKRRIEQHSWPCAEKRRIRDRSYEVQARQRRAYSPSAATSSEWLPSSAIRPSITTAMRSAS